jgi:3-oxoacyl-[acyl-carrier-protein] synthase-1
MTPLYLTATTLVTALGRGLEETMESLRAGRGGLTPCDFADTPRLGHIGRVPGVEDWALPAHTRKFACRNNALADMALRTDGFIGRIEAATQRYGADRIATVVGTSTSGILAAEDAYRARDPETGALPPEFRYADTHDLYALARFVRQTLGLRGPAMTVSTACASSARAFIDAHHLIEAGMADAALVGGADSLCRLTLHGFAALDLISPQPCRPCDADRSGISIGEAAGFALLEREPAGGGIGIALLGYGSSSDGYHMSSPRPDGAGAASAMRQALHEAGLTHADVDYINLHGTGTKANDAMEDAAVFSVFGTGPICSSTKGSTGHTMGSCGIVEAIIATLSIGNDFIPGCLGVSEVDPAFRIKVAVENESRKVRHVLSNAFGFGGMNCSLLLGAA